MSTVDVHSLDTSTFEVQQPPKGFKEKLLSGIKILKSTKEFDGIKVPFAHEAYLKSKYGNVFSNEKRVDSFMVDIADKIESRNANNKYVLIEEIPWDISEFSEHIINFFRNKGYIANDMSTLVEGLTRHYLFLAWDNFHLAQDSINISGSEKPNE